MGTFKEWMLNQFNRDELSDIVKNGAISGFHGLIYYHETTALYNQFHEEIWDMLHDEADSQGIEILELITDFNGAKNVCSECTFKNLLVWFGAEKVAFEVTELEAEGEHQD